MIKYKLWNRQLGAYSPRIEIILYDNEYKQAGKIITSKQYAKIIPAEWIAPLTVYYRTEGTMGR